MDCTIYLNDRKYRFLDIGEGKCTLVLCYSMNVESLYQHLCKQFFGLERMIIIDISTCWNGEIDSLDDIQRNELFGDIRLLADIYWLEDYEIKIVQGLEFSSPI